jgi:hypothetical protein
VWGGSYEPLLIAGISLVPAETNTLDQNCPHDGDAPWLCCARPPWVGTLYGLAIFVLALAAVPTLASPVPAQTVLPAAEFVQTTLAPCLNEAATGVMGREGGLLSLLGVDGHPEPVSTILNGEAYAPYAVHNGTSATYVVFVKTDKTE